MSILNQSFSTDIPNFNSVEHPIKPKRISIAGPYPTNNNFDNLVVEDGTYCIVVGPYIVWKNVDNGGFNLNNFFQLTVTEKYITSNRVINFGLGGDQSDAIIIKWDLLSAQVQIGTQIWYLVEGNPFITVKCAASPVKLFTQHAVTDLKIQSNRYDVTLNNNQIWSVFHEGSLTVVKKDNNLETTGLYTGIIRIIQTDLNKNLDPYVNKYPISGSVSYKVNSGVATISFTWDTDDMKFNSEQGGLLMYTLPHQRDILEIQTEIGDLPIFNVIKGELRPRIGTVWNMTEKLPTYSFESRLTVDPKYQSEVIAALTIDQNQIIDGGLIDPYFYGKKLSLLAQLITIANDLNQPTIRDNILIKLKKYTVDWLTGVRGNSFVYDKTWGGLISSNGLKDFGADFGNAKYNDHIFQYGYFLHAIALIVKYDPSFYDLYKNQILSIARDVGNPSTNDPYFTVTRNKDWFQGHSWASGLWNFADDVNIESSSEAVNGYYGLQLLGKSIGDKNMEEIGGIMLATEIRSAQKYWHITDNTIYPDPFAKNTTVGMIWSTKVDFATWFSSNIECIIGIQFLPFNAISEQLLDSKWITLAQPLIETSLIRADPVIADGWKTFIYLSKAIIDPKGSYNLVHNYTGGWDDGNTKTNGLYWILTRPGLGVDRDEILPSGDKIVDDITTDGIVTIGSACKTIIIQKSTMIEISIAKGTTVKFV